MSALEDAAREAYGQATHADILQQAFIEGAKWQARRPMPTSASKPAAEPLFYVKRQRIMQRPVKSVNHMTMGFHVCTVAPGVDPEAVCSILNLGDPGTEGQ